MSQLQPPQVGVPSVSHRPLTSAERKQLESYVGLGPVMARIAMFAGTVGTVGLILWASHTLISKQFSMFSDPLWWVTPLLLFAAWLYVRAARWTGGRKRRVQIRADLAAGVASVTRIEAVKAMQVVEHEGHTQTYILKTDSGQTIYFSGQYLEKYCRNGFPWREFDIVEAPESKVFFALTQSGEPLAPADRRQPFEWDTVKSFGDMNKNYLVLDYDYETVRTL